MIDLDNLRALVAGWTGQFIERRGELWFVDGLPGATLHDAHNVADVDDGAKHVATMLNALPALLADHARLTAEVAGARAAFDELAAIKREEMQALPEEVQAAGQAARPLVCGWCVQAAGGDEAAWVAAPRYTLDEVRAHTLSCPHNPLVVRAQAAEAEVARLRDVIRDAREAWASTGDGDYTMRALRKEAAGE